MGTKIALYLSIMRLLLFIAQWFEHKGNVNDARKAVEDDLIHIGQAMVEQATAARDAAAGLGSDIEWLRDDPDNRDTGQTGSTGDDREGGV